MKKIDLIGRKFSRLLVQSLAQTPENKKGLYWSCLCDCGVTKIVCGDYLTKGSTKSCGCLNNEQRSARARNMYSKNIKYTPLEASAQRVFTRNTYSDGNLCFNTFHELSQMNCHYCDTPPSNIYNTSSDDVKASQHKKDNGIFIYNGLDRIDSSIPHNEDNVVPCCKYCNYAKRERTVEEFKAWISKVSNHLKLK